MRYIPLIWAALRRRPVRSLLTFLSILVAFVLIGILAAVTAGFSHLIDVARLDRLYTASRFGTPLPFAYVEKIASVRGVTLAAPQSTLRGYFRDQKNPVFIAMVRPEFFATHPEMPISQQQLNAFLQNRTSAIVTVALAQAYGWKLGDNVPVNSATLSNSGNKVWTFHIVALAKDADYPDFRFMAGNYDYFDKARVTGQGTIDSVTTRTNDPNRAAQISQAIDNLFANSPAPTRTISEKANQQSGIQSLGDVNVLTRTVIGAVLFMLLFLTGNTMMQSVRERIPEFAVLKTLGFSDAGMLALIFGESLLLCTLAGAAGLLVVKIGFSLLHSRLPQGIGVLMLVSWPGLLAGFGFALVVALISALLPALRIRRMNIVDALAGR